MAKRFTILSSQPSASAVATSTQPRPTDWSLCALCQEVRDQALICPAFSTRHNYGSGYETICKNILAFSELGFVPLSINISRLDDGTGIEETLISQKAQWHKSCFNKFSTLKLQRAQKRKSDDISNQTSPVKTRSVQGVIIQKEKSVTKKKCFFCDKTDGDLHRASTIDIDRKVRCYAAQLKDTKLLAKLAMGDMHAIDADYHKTCLVGLYNRFRQTQRCSTEDTRQESLEGIALAELVSYIEENRMNTDVVHIFKLSELVKLYTSRLRQLKANIPDRVNSTRLKERLLFQMPDLRAHRQGRDILLGIDDDIGAALKYASENSYDDEAMILAKAARVVRREMLDKKQNFEGTFTSESQQNSVPDSLLALVNMILDGTNIIDQTGHEKLGNSAALVISQLLIFNCVKNARRWSKKTHHNVEKETPLPIYIGLSVHAHTRKRFLVDKLHRLGLSISYDRILQISSDLGNSVCSLYDNEQVVCPPKLKINLFTTACVDNIDHNPSSRTASDSFHGTAISLSQHPSCDFPGDDRGVVVINPNLAKSKTISELPKFYTDIQPVLSHSKDLRVPKTECSVTSPSDLILPALDKEMEWLSNVKELLQKDQLHEKDYLSWAAFHASTQTESPKPMAITALLPLFSEQAHTKGMILHAMKVIKNAVENVNPGQTPVIAVDQPLFAIAKQIQWETADTYGENNLVIMMGGLHIEIAALRTVGKWLEKSGWTSILVQANITTPGKADAILTASHLTRSRYAHQVTAAALYILQARAYATYAEAGCQESEPKRLQEWTEEQSSLLPQFKYWLTVFQLELLVMEYVRSLREGNFLLYVQTLGELVPWFFALDQHNYARWVPVHIRDMLSLSFKHPKVYEQFMEGNCVIRKTNHSFSLIALDQNHEQQNRMIKGDGGAVGLTQDPAALRRWMISGPEIARVVSEFETSYLNVEVTDVRHHEQNPGVQHSFATDVNSLVTTIEDMGNPFLEDSVDLLTLDNNIIMSDIVVESVKNAHQLGRSQYNTYVQDILIDRSKPVTDTIHKNNIPLFSAPSEKLRYKAQQQISSLKNDCNLFSRLFISCQLRDGNLAEFFKHENQACPPSLSSGGNLRIGVKSDLLSCLEDDTLYKAPEVDAKILDGAVIVNMLPPVKCKTFADYAKNVFIPYIVSQANSVKRIDIVWDTYTTTTLKQTRNMRGRGVRQRVVDHGCTPGNWQSFLRSDDNKTELFSLLAQHVKSLVLEDKIVISTLNVDVISCSNLDKEGLAPCSHEEGDTRILLHAAHAGKKGYSRLMIRTVDTDIVVLCISNMARINLQELWIAFGVGKNFRYIPVHKIARSLITNFCTALPFFHAITGCDTVSAFCGRGKKKAYETWKAFSDVTSVFCALSTQPRPISEKDQETLERFVVLLYSRTCPSTRVNEARQILFAQGSRSIENIPPTQAALREHIKRATLQAGYIWGQALVPSPVLPNPADWGWEWKNDRWTPVWTTLPEASVSCRELIHCGCRKTCRGLCKCYKANLNCTALCYCAGNCHQ